MSGTLAGCCTACHGRARRTPTQERRQMKRKHWLGVIGVPLVGLAAVGAPAQAQQYSIATSSASLYSGAHAFKESGCRDEAKTALQGIDTAFIDVSNRANL